VRSLLVLAILIAVAVALPMRTARSKHAAAAAPAAFAESDVAVAVGAEAEKKAEKAFFTKENFRFISEYEEDITNNKFIGSVYFTDAGKHARMRLCHDSGPSIGGERPDGVWVFFEDENDAATFPRKGCIAADTFAALKVAATSKIVELKNNADPADWAAVAGYRVYEWTLDPAKGYCSIHPSRGRVFRNDAVLAVTTAAWGSVFDAVSSAEALDADTGNTQLGTAIKALIDAGTLPADFSRIGCFPEEDKLEEVEIAVGAVKPADITEAQDQQIKAAVDAVAAKTGFWGFFDKITHPFKKSTK